MNYYDCPICLDNIDETKNNTITNCGHKFHTSCLIKNISLNGFECPYCREQLFLHTQNYNEEKVLISNDLIFIENENYIFNGFRWFYQRNNNEELEEINDEVNSRWIEDEMSYYMVPLQDIINEFNKVKIKNNELIEYILNDFNYENLRDNLKNRSFKKIYTKLREMDENYKNKLIYGDNNNNID